MAYDFSLTEEQQALIQTARDFTKKEITPVAREFDESGEFPRDILHRAWQTGLLNLEIPDRDCDDLVVLVAAQLGGARLIDNIVVTI